MSLRKKIIWIIILVPFLFMEIPGVFFIKDMTEPEIFGFPFIYGFILICWIVQAVSVGLACALNWGENEKKIEE